MGTRYVAYDIRPADDQASFHIVKWDANEPVSYAHPDTVYQGDLDTALTALGWRKVTPWERSCVGYDCEVEPAK